MWVQFCSLCGWKSSGLFLNEYNMRRLGAEIVWKLIGCFIIGWNCKSICNIILFMHKINHLFLNYSCNVMNTVITAKNSSWMPRDHFAYSYWISMVLDGNIVKADNLRCSMNIARWISNKWVSCNSCGKHKLYRLSERLKGYWMNWTELNIENAFKIWGKCKDL